MVEERTRIKTFSEFYDAFLAYRDDQHWVFRGQKDDPSWKLRPKAGRDLIKIPDQNLFRVWKRYAAALESPTFKSDWDWLALAQHHRLATRLLDWTLNPLVAAYFALHQAQDGDGAVYAYFDLDAEDAGLAREPKQAGQESQPEPFDIDGIKKVRPRYITKRLLVQSGIFTIHNPPTARLEENITDRRKLEKIVIDRAYLQDLRRDLSFYGINESTMFPDLNGLSSFMNWWYHPEHFKEY